MIKDMKALSLAEANEYIAEEQIKTFIKKFTKIKPGEAIKIREDIEKLNNMKIKPEHISKIIDILPEDNQDVAKIFTDIGLDEDETKQILEIVKKHK